MCFFYAFSCVLILRVIYLHYQYETNIIKFKKIYKMRNEKITRKHLAKIINGKYETKIVNLLFKCKTETVNNIAEKVDLDQPTTSQILKRLLKVGIVVNQRVGKYVHYAIIKERYEAVCHTYTQLVIEEKNKINSLLKGTNTRQRDPIIYKQKSPIFSGVK